MVHRREVNGDEVVFGNQGDLWQNAMTWFDHDTGSVWSQPTGTAIMGPLLGERLELLPSTLTTWDDWRHLHPETRALNVGSTPRGFEVSQTAVVVAVGDDSLAVPVSDLVDVGVLQAIVGGEPVAVVADDETEQWIVYSRLFLGAAIDLAIVDGVLTDPQSGRTFDLLRGNALDGSGALDRIPAFSSFPTDYIEIFPQGRVFTDGRFLPASALQDSDLLEGAWGIQPVVESYQDWLRNQRVS
jgi:hypothetical protein